MDVRVGPKRKLSTEELMFLNWVLEKTLESPLDSKNKPVHPKGNQPWIFIRRADAEAETPILWIPDAKSQLIGKDPNARKDCGQEEKGVAEDEMLGWYHWLNRHEFEQLWEVVKTGKPGVLQSMRSQTVGHDLLTEQHTSTHHGNSQLSTYNI